MALKKLSRFEWFDFAAFISDKTLVFASSEPLYEGQDRKKVIGTRVNVLITKDNTDYGDATVTNKYQTLTLKVPGKIGLTFAEDAEVRPVGQVTAKVWGQYRNELSVTCEDVQAVKKPPVMEHAPVQPQARSGKQIGV